MFEHHSGTTESTDAQTKLTLRNSEIVLQRATAGVVARIERDVRPRVEYAGPLDEDTIDSLREVQE
jgi:hypothetical protein